MIDSQLRTSGVNAGFVLERMGAVPRENFVPEGARAHAYVDRAVALGGGRFLAAPLVQGRMLEEAAPALSDRALVVDGGSGYLPALLADDARSVTGLLVRGITKLATGRKSAGAVALIPLAEMGIPVLPEFAAPKG